jgi:CO/xanthine dehydrogenase Mo-binding subunit
MQSLPALPSTQLDRRSFLKRSGSLVIAFSLMTPTSSSFGLEAAARPTTSVNDLDAWLEIGNDGKVTLFCGKIEMGQGISTAFAQMVADELDVPFDAVSIVICDTARTPDQGVSSASRGISAGGSQIRLAAAEARLALLDLASSRLSSPVETLSVKDGIVSNGSARASYAELLRDRRFERKLTGKAKTKAPADFRIIGTSTPRVDIPSKVTGSFVYVHDIEVPGMVHARVIRPAQVGAKVISIDGFNPPRPHITIVRKNDFVAVAAESEWEAEKAARDLRVHWSTSKSLPAGKPLADTLRAMPSIDVVFNKKGDVDPEFDKPGQTVSASYLWPFQSHGSIGPSCAVADVGKDGTATIWSAGQDVYRHRDALAQLLHTEPAKVRIIYTHGSGCYGHNGADDVGADAALISQQIGRPVRVQWTREDEHGWAPRGSPFLVDLRARLSPEGRVLAWDLKSRSMTFSSRFRYYGKQQSGYVLAAQLAGERADTAIVAEPGRILNTSMTSSTVTLYAFANARTTICALPTAEPHPLRPSELRSVSAIAATFAIESFVDELALGASQRYARERCPERSRQTGGMGCASQPGQRRRESGLGSRQRRRSGPEQHLCRGDRRSQRQPVDG